MNLSHRFTGQNFLLIWLNSNDHESMEYCRNTLIQIEQIVNKTTIFTDSNMCVDFLTDIIDEKVFLFISTDSSRQFIPLIHDVTQLYSIYVFTDDVVEHGSWTNKFRKVKCVSRSIERICKLLRKDTERCDHDFTPISIIPSDRCATKDLNELPSSFMYSQILKEILSDIGDHQNTKEDLVHFWYQQYFDNGSQLEKIGEFDRTYRPDSAIQWYSRENFIYSILNRALRTLDADLIIKMGFFLRDLDQQIKELYEKQSTNRVAQTVYRGQAMNNEEFEKLRQSQDGLLSFNNFLSTSANPNVAEMFYPNPAQDPNFTAVLFKIKTDPTRISAPFAVLNDQQTNFPEEEEILFSMHSVFRIVRVVEMKKDLWQVTLTPTSDNDQTLIKLTDCIREEIKGGTGWQRLGHLLIKIGSLDKAEEIYQIIFKQTSPSDSQTLAFLFNQLGLIHHQKGNFTEALKWYTERLNIEEKYIFPNYSDLAVNYSNVASINLNMGKYSEAMKFYEKTLKIEQTYLPPDSPTLATTYSNIGLVYRSNGNYREAIQMYQKALEIGNKSLPLFHPDLIPIYNNIAAAYYHLGDYSNAVQFHEKTLQIERRSLPANHPYLAMTYCFIGLLHKKMENYTTALTFYQKALEIYRESPNPDHPNLAVIYSNIASLHHAKQEYSDALELYHRTLKIEQKFYGSCHLEVARTYSNIAALYDSQDEYRIALQFYEKVQKIYEKHLPSDHLDFATLYKNIAVVYFKLEDYLQASYFFQRALPIYQKSLPENHPLILDCEENIAFMLNPSAFCL